MLLVLGAEWGLNEMINVRKIYEIYDIIIEKWSFEIVPILYKFLKNEVQMKDFRYVARRIFLFKKRLVKFLLYLKK